MGDFSEKYSSWGGTNNVLVSSSQESEESSSKYNFADSNDNSSMNENVQENPYKYTSPDANSKIYVTNEYSQYVTKQWSQSQAAKRYSIQTPKVQNPRYNIQPPPTQMTEEVFKEQYKSTFEKFLEIFWRSWRYFIGNIWSWVWYDWFLKRFFIRNSHYSRYTFVNLGSRKGIGQNTFEFYF